MRRNLALELPADFSKLSQKEQEERFNERFRALQQVVSTVTEGGGAPVKWGTHEARTPAGVAGQGALYFETDRTVLYVCTLWGGDPYWQYCGGVMFATFSDRPTDLATPDGGFMFYTKGTGKIYFWAGGMWTQVAGPQQGDPGVPSFAALSDAEAYCASLRTALRVVGILA